MPLRIARVTAKLVVLHDRGRSITSDGRTIPSGRLHIVEKEVLPDRRAGVQEMYSSAKRGYASCDGETLHARTRALAGFHRDYCSQLLTIDDRGSGALLADQGNRLAEEVDPLSVGSGSDQDNVAARSSVDSRLDRRLVAGDLDGRANGESRGEREGQKAKHSKAHGRPDSYEKGS